VRSHLTLLERAEYATCYLPGVLCGFSVGRAGDRSPYADLTLDGLARRVQSSLQMVLLI
jgi:hypothetical protein